MNKYPQLLLAAMVLSVTACGGGGDGGSSDNAPATNPASAIDNSANGGTGTGTDNGQVLTGRLVDSAVIGMSYETATQSGVTGADGSYSYLANETVTFSLGDIVLPAVNSAPVVTPLDVFSTTDITDTRVMNLARLLQSLDEDGNPENGIDIPAGAAASATGLSVDFASANFDTQVVNLVANSGSSTTSLIDGMTALTHFQETLFEEGIEERPQAPENTQAATPDSGNSASHPLVGTSAEFSNFSHGIAGTLTVLDDRTLQVSDFFYDGGGVTVFFYLGTDGDFRSPGIEVGELLNGFVWTGETITIPLPAGVTLDDFNAVSVWCVPFGVDFGSAQL